MLKREKIRNFAIIAHIDHGKSTFADRILEFTNTVEKRILNSQHLDSMDIEKERGITIKLNAVQIKYKDFIFHLIDTPGHVDFTYEVSRSLAACEGVVLLVDATQGIEAQTLANVYLAFDHNLKIIPVINKIDLPSAKIDIIKEEIENVIGISQNKIIPISSKTGENVPQVLDRIIKDIPIPKGSDSKPLKALIFDSYFDNYRGIILFIRVFDGQIKVHDQIQFMTTQKTASVVELGIKNPQEIKKNFLQAGEVGWVAASIRDAKEILIGDTITLVDNPTDKPLSGYHQKQSVVFVGFFPIDGNDYEKLKDALEKISLSDSSINYEQETSQALGHGFRVGFLGLLHLEVIQERLQREFNVDLIATSPSVEFLIYKTNGSKEIFSNPASFPDPTYIKKIEERFIKANILIPNQYIGNVMKLCKQKRGQYINLEYIDDKRSKLIYKLPLVEIIFDFFDTLKSISKGYASFDYEMIGFFATNIVKVDVLLNGEKIDAFSFVVHRDFAQKKARSIVEKIAQFIPKHNFEIPVQGVIGGKIIARANVKAYRKDVTAKLYGGDRTRRDKLLKKQKKGKLRAKRFGLVEVPQDVFIKVLKNKENSKKGK